MREAIVSRGSRIRNTIGRVVSSASSGKASPTWNVISFTTSALPAAVAAEVADGLRRSSSSAARSSGASLVPGRLEGLVAVPADLGWFQRMRASAVEAVRGGATIA